MVFTSLQNGLQNYFASIEKYVSRLFESWKLSSFKFIFFLSLYFYIYGRYRLGHELCHFSSTASVFRNLFSTFAWVKIKRAKIAATKNVTCIWPWLCTCTSHVQELHHQRTSKQWKSRLPEMKQPRWMWAGMERWATSSSMGPGNMFPGTPRERCNTQMGSGSRGGSDNWNHHTHECETWYHQMSQATKGSLE